MATEDDTADVDLDDSKPPVDAEDSPHFGKRLEVLLNLAGVSQRQIAQAARIDPSALSRLKQSAEARNDEIGRLGEALEGLGREELRDATKILLGLKPLPSAQRPKSALFVHLDGVLDIAGFGNEPSITAIKTLAERHRDPVFAFVYSTRGNLRASQLVPGFESQGFQHLELADRVNDLAPRVAADVLKADRTGASVYIFVGFGDWLGPIAQALKSNGMHVIIGLPTGAPLPALALDGSTVVRIPPAAEERRRDSQLSNVERVVIDHLVDPGAAFTPWFGGFTFPYLVTGLVKCHQHGETFSSEEQAAEVVRACLDKGILNQGGVRVPGEARSIELDLTHPLVRQHLETKVRPRTTA